MPAGVVHRRYPSWRCCQARRRALEGPVARLGGSGALRCSAALLGGVEDFVAMSALVFCAQWIEPLTFPRRRPARPPSLQSDHCQPSPVMATQATCGHQALSPFTYAPRCTRLNASASRLGKPGRRDRRKRHGRAVGDQRHNAVAGVLPSRARAGRRGPAGRSRAAATGLLRSARRARVVRAGQWWPASPQEAHLCWPVCGMRSTSRRSRAQDAQRRCCTQDAALLVQRPPCRRERLLMCWAGRRTGGACGAQEAAGPLHATGAPSPDEIPNNPAAPVVRLGEAPKARRG